VQRVTGRIIQDAKERAKSVIDQAKESAEALLENRSRLAREKAEDDERSFSKRVESEIETAKEKIIADAKKRAGWMVLCEKERLITEVLEGVKHKLNDLTKSGKYVRVLEDMIIDAGTALKGGALEVVLNNYSLSLPLRMKQLAEEITGKTGVRTQLKLSSEEIESFGTIVRTVDGRMLVDNTFEAMVRRREKELRFQIARILFGNR